MIPQNLAVLFRDTVGRFPHKKAFFYKESGRYESYTWSEFQRKVESVATFLADKGLKAGDRLAIFSENRPEWALIDLAAQHLGAITVPIYTSLSSSEIQYLLADSGSRMIAVSNKALFEKIIPIQKKLSTLEAIIGFDASLSILKGEVGIPLFRMKDLERTPPSESTIREGIRSVSPDTVASIIYTSGTTGEPKGVLLTHANFLHNVEMTKKALRMSETDRHLSFLPLSHVFERLAGHYLMIAMGASITYAENMDTVRENLLEVKPTFLLGVPRFYEKIKEHVTETVDRARPLKKGVFYWAKELGAEKRKADRGRRPLGIFFKMEYAFARRMVYQKFQDSLGGSLRFCISGGAPLPKEVAEFFCDLGVMIYEGYGLTETSPVISVNRENDPRFGTVGIPLEGVEVRISEESEILTKSPCVMKGYYHKEEETRAVLKDGWFYTGDLGKLDRDGFLSITGRKKELIVTSGGKKVAPCAIEEKIENDPFILRCVLFGEGRRFLTAFIVPHREALELFARKEKIAFSSYKELLGDSKIYHFFENRIEALSKDLAPFEKIKYFALLEQDFSQSAGELTPTLKIKREVIAARYKDKLLPFYENDRA